MWRKFLFEFDSQLIKDDSVEELFLSFHAQILKSFLFHKSENNDCFFDYQFLKSNLFDFFQIQDFYKDVILEIVYKKS